MLICHMSFMQIIELNDFYNEGFGWICKHCERELKAPEIVRAKQSRLMREGEAESKSPRLSNRRAGKMGGQGAANFNLPALRNHGAGG